MLYTEATYFENAFFVGCQQSNYLCFCKGKALKHDHSGFFEAF